MVFFTAAEEQFRLLKKKASEAADLKFTIDINLRQMTNIFSWIVGHRAEICAELGDKRFAVFSKNITALGYTFEVVRHFKTKELRLFINIHSKIPIDDLETGKPKKLVEKVLINPETGEKTVIKSKVLGSGMSKVVVRALCWDPKSKEFLPYAEASLKNIKEKDLASAEKEEVFSYRFGPYANPAIMGSNGIKNGKPYQKTYSPLAIGDELDFFNEGKEHFPRLGSISFEQFFFFLYKHFRGLAFIHNSGMILRDLKPENLLLFMRGNILDPRFIDLSFTVYADADPASLKNDHGSYNWISPESDIFTEVRSQQILILTAQKKVNQLRFIPRTDTPVIVAQINLDREKRKMAKLLKKSPIKEHLGEYQDAIKTILESQYIESLTPDSKGPNQFLSHPKDDCWALSKMIVLFIGYYLHARQLSPLPEREIQCLNLISEKALSNQMSLRNERQDSVTMLAEIGAISEKRLSPQAYPALWDQFHKLATEEESFLRTLAISKGHLSEDSSREAKIDVAYLDETDILTPLKSLKISEGHLSEDSPGEAKRAVTRLDEADTLIPKRSSPVTAATSPSSALSRSGSGSDSTLLSGRISIYSYSLTSPKSPGVKSDILSMEIV